MKRDPIDQTEEAYDRVARDQDQRVERHGEEAEDDET